jgi:hypothetical protein
VTENVNAIASSRTRRLSAALGTALLALLVAVGPVAAVSWTGESQISATDTFRPTTLRTGPSRAAVIWQTASAVYLRRTTDGGATWLDRQTLVTGIGPAFAASGSGRKLDIVYTKRRVSSTGTVTWRLYYKRSLDGGATWSTARALISSSASASDFDVARHSNGQVSVVWTAYTTGRIYIRTSTDGGSTFRTAVRVARSTDYEPGAQPYYRGNVSVGIGSKGTTYVAYTPSVDRISVRRSLNRGGTWSSPTSLTGAGAPEIQIVADGAKAIVAYMRSSNGQMQAVYRRTADRGTTWSKTRQTVALGTGEFSLWPHLSYHAGVLALEVKAGTPGDSPVWYRQSTDFGRSWSAKEQVSQVNVEDSDPEPGGVALLDGRILATYFENRGTDNEGMWVRTGTR